MGSLIRRMSQILVCTCFIVMVCSQAQAAQNKGIGVVVKDRFGRDVGLYKGSYALLVGVSKYTGGWNSLPSVPAEVDTVKSALEALGFKVGVVKSQRIRGKSLSGRKGDRNANCRETGCLFGKPPCQG